MSFTLLMGPPGPEARALAEKELRETEENVKNGIETLRKYIEEDKTIHYCTDDDFLLIFLRPCKFYPQSAFELMKRVADFRNKHAALFYDLIPSDERDAIMNHDVMNVLKTRDHKNRRVMIIQAGKNWDPSKVTSDQILRMLYIVHLLAIQEQETQVHFVKQPFLFNMVWTMFKPFVREKLRKRMFFHGNNMSSLHTHIPVSHLPKNYGGDLPEIDYNGADWYPTMLAAEDKIKEWNTYGYTKK
ncbi:clavesin-1 isoform X2 [Polyergus mexicanus]|uniref:clavesin-1 isoform X2 n=1 Tax=Polyergus mexicanus TaxID=615972 RepID=UPI0038B58BB3